MRFIYGILASLGVFGIVSFWILCIGILIGWLLNIIKLLFSLPGVIGGEVTDIGLEIVLRLIGIPLAPIGGLLGYM